MLYIIKTENDDETIFLENSKCYTSIELKELISTIKFNLSHHINTLDIINILCKNYGFKIIEQVFI